MAEKRMFAKSIVFSDAFLDMPLSSRCLYFSLSMCADDDGFVDSPKSIIRQIGASTDDMNILLARQFVLAFDNGVIVIKHWRLNNYLRSDRYKETLHKREKNLLVTSETGEYFFDGDIQAQIKTDNSSGGIPTGIPMVDADKNRIEKNRKDKDIYPPIVPPTGGADADELFDQFWKVYPKKIGKGAAKKAFYKALKKEGVSVEALIDAVERQKEGDQWVKDGGSYIPNPTTWLNQERWEDEVLPVKVPKTRRQSNDIDWDEIMQWAREEDAKDAERMLYDEGTDSEDYQDNWLDLSEL